jgi:hypothetical protein
MKVSSRHIVETSVPIPPGVGLRVTDRRLHITSESPNSTSEAMARINRLTGFIIAELNAKVVEQG